MSENQPKESKIPVLTEVYQPKTKQESFVDSKQNTHIKHQSTRQDDPTLGITPEFIARVTGHVRPRLEAEITQTVLDNLRNILKKDLIKELQIELENTKLAVEARTANFVDKTKADLKTELPRMYQASADLVHTNLSEKIAVLQTEAVTKVDRLLTDVMQTSTHAASAEIATHVEALKTEATARVVHNMNQELQAFQAESLQQFQTHFSNEMTNAYQVITENAQLALQQQLQFMQDETLTQMRNNLAIAMPEIHDTAVSQVKSAFVDEMNEQSAALKESFLTAINGDLPAVQEILRDNIQQILASALPVLESDLRRQLTDELQELLLKVKFRLP